MCKLISSYSSSAHELLLQFLSVITGWCASRATLPPVRWKVRPRHPAGAGVLGRRPSAAPRGRNTRRWGAGVLPGRARCRRDRVRRPVGRARPSRRSPATTRACWPAADIRCRSGPDLPEEMPSGLARLIGSRATESQHYRLTPVRFRTGRARPTLAAWPTRSCSTTGSWVQHSTSRNGSRTTCPPGRRVRRPARRTDADADGLVLDIPVDHPAWCPDDHLRRCGSRGSSRAAGRVRWARPAASSATATGCWCRRSSRGSRAASSTPDGWRSRPGCASPRARWRRLWLSGFEDDPEQLQCGELCVFEVFGNALGPADAPSAEVGVGIKAFRDPALTQDFAAPQVAIDVTEPHAYAVEWDAAEAVFTVDGAEVRRCPRPPTYPMQLMLAVFDFPEWSQGDDDHLVPELTVAAGHGDLVSTLQCPATLLVVRDDADLTEVSAGRRISHVWSADPTAGALAAGRLGVGCSVVEALASGEVHALREALGDIADRTPGETTVVLGLDDLRAALVVLPASKRPRPKWGPRTPWSSSSMPTTGPVAPGAAPRQVNFASYPAFRAVSSRYSHSITNVDSPTSCRRANSTSVPVERGDALGVVRDVAVRRDRGAVGALEEVPELLRAREAVHPQPSPMRATTSVTRSPKSPVTCSGLPHSTGGWAPGGGARRERLHGGEHLPEEALRRPADQSDRAAGANDPDQLVGAGLVVRREHHADAGHHHAEPVVAVVQGLGVRLLPHDVQRRRRRVCGPPSSSSGVRSLATTDAPRLAAGMAALPVPAATSSTRSPASMPHASTSTSPRSAMTSVATAGSHPAPTGPGASASRDGSVTCVVSFIPVSLSCVSSSAVQAA